jgi:hypothetical protein
MVAESLGDFSMRAALAAMAILLATTSAAPAAADPSPRALELAQRYARAIHFDQQMAAMMDGVVPAIVEQSLREKGQAMTTEMKAAVGRAAAETGRAMAPKMLERMIPVIAELYTEAELQAAVAFYESAPGQSMLAKTAALTARTAPALAALGPEIEADFETRLCREVNCEGGRPTSSPSTP